MYLMPISTLFHKIFPDYHCFSIPCYIYGFQNANISLFLSTSPNKHLFRMQFPKHNQRQPSNNFIYSIATYITSTVFSSFRFTGKPKKIFFYQHNFHQTIILCYVVSSLEFIAGVKEFLPIRQLYMQS